MGLIPFCGLSFITRPGVVMTPRPASERLVRAAAGLVGERPARVADVGTGSGALASPSPSALHGHGSGRPTRAPRPSSSPA